MKAVLNLAQWVVLSRPDCSLCEIFLEELSDVLGSQFGQIGVFDISADEALERKYGSRIPVLLIDDEFVCAIRLDRARVQAYLSS